MAIAMGGERQQAVINVTPLIDVLLVLLIIFMAITPVKQTGLNAALPQNTDKSPLRLQEHPIIVEITQSGSYQLNSEPVEAAALAGRLVSAFASRAQRVLWVKADGGLEFQRIAEVIDTARDANIDRVALLPGR